MVGYNLTQSGEARGTNPRLLFFQQAHYARLQPNIADMPRDQRPNGPPPMLLHMAKMMISTITNITAPMTFHVIADE